MLKKKIFIPLFGVLAGLFLFFSVPGTVSAAAEFEGVEWTGNSVGGVSTYGGAETELISEKEVKEAGVPQGSAGDVLKVTSDKGTFGVTFDFGEISRIRIESFSVRFYAESTSADTASYPEIRVCVTPNVWVRRELLGLENTDKWLELNFTQSEIDSMCPNGKLVQWELSYRGNAPTNVYIDEIDLRLSDSDVTPPVLEMPTKEYRTEAGSIPVYDDIKATDESGQVELIYEWSEGALDGFGRLTEGTHTLKIIAADAYGNTADATVTYIVTAADTLEVYSVTFRWKDGEKRVEYTGKSAFLVCPPDVEAPDHYSVSWGDYTLAMQEEQIINAVYTPEIYTVSFTADGASVGAVEYTVEDMKITEPEIPEKRGYTGEWEEYVLQGGDMVVEAVYTPVIYSLTFVAEGEVVAVVYYTAETEAVEEPAVPSKDGVAGQWEKYELDFSDTVVYAEYEYENGSGCGSAIGVVGVVGGLSAAIVGIVLPKKKHKK